MSTFLATIILPVETELAELDGWQPGPLPVVYSPLGSRADAAARSTYLDRRAADMLYGTDRRGDVRSHRTCDAALPGPFRLTALEWVRVRDHSALAGMLIVHLDAACQHPGELFPHWASLVRWKFDDAEGPGVLLDPIAEVLGRELRLHALHQSPFRIAFLDATPGDGPPMPGCELDDVAAWQFLLASAVTPGGFRPSPRQCTHLADAQIELSDDWSAMVLRDGAAFVGHAEAPPPFLVTSGGAYVVSIYTDALLLGVLQRSVLGDLTDRLAALDDPAHHPRAVEHLDAEFSRFRNRLWWQHLTQHGPGNDLLLAYRAQHRLDALMEGTKSELEDYSRQASLRAGRVLNLVVAALALIGALGVLAEIYRFFVADPAVPATTTLVVTGGVLVVVAFLVLTYPLGLVSRMAVHRRKPFVPRAHRRRLRR